MKQYKQVLVLLRISAITTVLIYLSLFLSSYNYSAKVADDLWKQLGISQQQGAEKIRNSFMSGYLDYRGIRNFKNLSTGDKSAVAKDLLVYTKTYLSSDAVKSAYIKEKESVKPIAPVFDNLTKEDIRKREIAGMKKNIEETEAMVKKFPDMEKSAHKAIAEFEKTMKDFSAPDNKIIDILYQSQLFENKAKEDRYKESLKSWEQNYPADYRIKLKAHLEKYLNTSATVDFGAALTEKYGKKVFVNADYERKNAEWKMIFRAGKEVYAIAQPFAGQWLKELSGK